MPADVSINGHFVVGAFGFKKNTIYFLKQKLTGTRECGTRLDDTKLNVEIRKFY